MLWRRTSYCISEGISMIPLKSSLRVDCNSNRVLPSFDHCSLEVTTNFRTTPATAGQMKNSKSLNKLFPVSRDLHFQIFWPQESSLPMGSNSVQTKLLESHFFPYMLGGSLNSTQMTMIRGHTKSLTFYFGWEVPFSDFDRLIMKKMPFFDDV